jgi:hypothetical protein
VAVQGVPSQRASLTIDPARVVHETIDGEVILIQLERGNYYSLSGSGREVWALLCQGVSPADVSSHLTERYEAPAEEVEVAVSDLVEQLLQEGLAEENGANPAAVRPTPEDDGGSAAGFETPRLEKYTDMQDYLLIDPIHDVSEIGWPSVKPDERG